MGRDWGKTTPASGEKADLRAFSAFLLGPLTLESAPAYRPSPTPKSPIASATVSAHKQVCKALCVKGGRERSHENAQQRRQREYLSPAPGWEFERMLRIPRMNSFWSSLSSAFGIAPDFQSWRQSLAKSISNGFDFSLGEVDIKWF
jgi:hypothetical protein